METGVVMAPETQSSVALFPAIEGSEFLVRSRTEMRRILDVISEQQITLSVDGAGTGPVADTTLIFVEHNTSTLLFMCPVAWRDALASDQAERMMLRCLFDDAYVQFQAGHCSVIEVDGMPAVSALMPEFMWRFQRRRDKRYKIPAGPALKMTLNLGFIEVEAEVLDMSVSGVGAVSCGSEIRLDEGELLRGCTIALPGVGLLTVDMLVQHTRAMPGPDGSEATRVGCKFIGLNDDARDLVGAYVGALAANA